ncbi:hypothetical protein V2J09_017107 [Rumex salicifolius]
MASLIRDASDVEDIDQEKAPPANNYEAFRAETARVRQSARIELNNLLAGRKYIRMPEVPSHPKGLRFPRGVPLHFLMELAAGYALFNFRYLNEIEDNYESVDKYINYPPDQVFELEAFHQFPSDAHALSEMNAIADCNVSEELKSFLQFYLPKQNGVTSYYVVAATGMLGENITVICRMASKCSRVCENIMRVLRMSLPKLIPDIKPGDLENAQYNLARLYNKRALLCSSSSKQRCESCDSKVVSSFHGSSSQTTTVVAPHTRFEGVFTFVGNDDRNFICTKTLVPSEAFCGDELISLQGEDGSEAEYRVWDPLRSKLAAAIMCGANRIWVKPGSRILCVGGDICGSTLRHLSDIVGHSGVVYAVGNVVGKLECVLNMTKKRSNVIPIFENYGLNWKYRMLVGMVDIIYATSLGDLHKVPHRSFLGGKLNTVCQIARRYLKADGKFMISIPESLVKPSNPGIELFNCLHREFKINEVVKMEPFQEDVIVGGVFRSTERLA